MKIFLIALVTLSIFAKDVSANIIITFEEKTVFTGVSGASGSFYNGNSGSGTNSNGWTSQGVFFNNNYDSRFGGFWSGWSYSNVVNITSPGFGNQYAAFPGGGSNGIGGVIAGQMYAVAYNDGAYFNLPSDTLLHSVDLTNATYAAISMRDGDSFTKKFGGVSGNDPDEFGVRLKGFDNVGGTGNLLGSVSVNLADFRFADNSQDFIIGNWQNVSLSSIANARSVSLEFFSTDVGGFGINTPTYVALDNLRLTAVPEPSTLALVGLVASALAFRRYRAKRAKVRN